MERSTILMKKEMSLLRVCILLCVCCSAVWSADALDIDATGKATFSADVDVDGALKVGSGAAITEISTDGTFTADSDTKVPTEKAIKAYVDSLNVGNSPTLIESKVISTSVSTLTFNTDLNSSYKMYELRFYNMSISHDGGSVFMKFSNDAGMSWLTGANIYRYARMARDSSNVNKNYGTRNSLRVDLTGGEIKNSSSNVGVSGVVKLFNIAHATYPLQYTGMLTFKNIDNEMQASSIGGYLNDLSGVNALQLLTDNNFDGGTVEIWGIP